MKIINMCLVGSVDFKYLKSTEDNKNFLSINGELIELTPSIVENFYGFANDVFSDISENQDKPNENKGKSNIFTRELINSIIKDESQKITNDKL